jgi:hypothetical protein
VPKVGRLLKVVVLGYEDLFQGLGVGRCQPLDVEKRYISDEAIVGDRVVPVNHRDAGRLLGDPGLLSSRQFVM